jgi:hypothetical protein
MKSVNKSPYVAPDGTITWFNRLRGTLKYGLNWSAEMQAQEEVAKHLGRMLDNKFALLRNVPLPKLDLLIPLTLVGPSGVHVLYASPQKGIFRIKGNTFLVMDTTTRQFKPGRPNLVRRTLLYSRAVEVFLGRKGYSIPEVEPTLVFTDPGTHIDSVRPKVRIVQVDGLAHYGARLAQGRIQLNTHQARAIVNALLHPEAPPESEAFAETAPQPEVSGAEQLFPATTSPPQKTPEPSRVETFPAISPFTEEIPGVSDQPEFQPELPGIGPLRFTIRQWIILAAFFVVDVIVILAFLALVLLSS